MGFRWASEAARKGTGTFSRGLERRWVGIFSGGIGVGGGKMSQSPGLWRLRAEWVPVGARGGRFVVATMAGERLRHRPRVSPLPRDPLRPTQTTSSRGRGRGWGNIELSFPRGHANGFAIDSAAPHPPFGHLPPEGEGTVGGRFVGCGRIGCLWVSHARPEGDRHIFPRSWVEVGWNFCGWDWGGGRENEPVPGAMAVGGGLGSCGGVGCSGGRFDGDLRTTSPLAARPPLSRATRCAQHNRPRRGGGAGGGGTSSCRSRDGMRGSSPLATRPLIRPLGTFPRRGKAPLVVDSLDVGGLGACGCRLRVRRGTGTFSRGLGRRWVGIFSGGIGVGGGKMSQSPGLWRLGADWVPVGAWGARVVVSTAICERVRRWLRVSPLPRDPLCPTQATSSRGRGRG